MALEWNLGEYFLFALTMSITPGPNNTMLLASGMNNGLKGSLPVIFGIFTGFGLLVTVCGLGIGAVVAHNPGLYVTLAVVGSLYLLWLAYKIATQDHGQPAKPAGSYDAAGFFPAAFLQLVNPKAWMMGITASSVFFPLGIHPVVGAILLGGLFALVYLPCGFIWAGGGATLQRLLNNPRQIRYINYGLALMLILTVAGLAFDVARHVQN